MSLDRIPGEAKLYIGGLFSLRRHEALKKANITHVVSALRLPLDQNGSLKEQDLFKDFRHHVVDLDDVEDEDIIQYFPASNAFIQEGLDGGGGVLVHCAMGKSRSTTLLIAYLLSSSSSSTTTTGHTTLTQHTTPNSLLNLIRQSRPFAEPNPGFMSQLDLYHHMRMPASPDALAAHPEYQRWLYQRAVEESNSRGVAPAVGEIRFADSATSTASHPEADAPLTSTKTSPPPVAGSKSLSARKEQQQQQAATETTTAPSPTTYKCRRCRTHLATSAHAVAHSPTKKAAPASSEPCAHLFVEPLSWMRPELELGKMEGRLECPNARCGTGVGRYAWQGLRCSCGAWVVPGVSLARGKVDEVREVGGGGGGTGVRRPPPAVKM